MNISTTGHLFLAFVFGAVTAGILSICTILLFLGEAARPIDFSILLLVTLPGLLVAAFASRIVGGIWGAICGLVFSCPIVITCYVIASYDPAALREHGRQFGYVSCVTSVISIIVMAFRGKTNLWAKPPTA